MAKLIAEIMEEKGAEIWSVEPDSSVFDTVRMMAEKRAGAILVMESGKLAGIISERDCARRIILEDKNSRSTPVSEIMTSNVITVSPERTLEECLALMTQKNIRHLPVMDQGKIAGVLSIKDLAEHIIRDQQLAIEQLSYYIND